MERRAPVRVGRERIRLTAPVLIALACGACMRTPTEFVVVVDTDLPTTVALTLSASVVDAAGHHTAMSRLGTRGPGDAGIHLPATFGITSGAVADNGTVQLSVTAVIAPGTSTEPTLTVVRRQSLTFVPGVTQRVRVFLSRACTAIVAGCHVTPAAQCTRSALCDEMGLTCDDRGDCVAPPHVQGQTDAGVDTGIDVCAPQCSGRLCGDDRCSGSCGACAAGQSCTSGGTCMTNCGTLGAPCCAGSMCTQAGTACVSGTCSMPPPCGTAGEPCCSGSNCTQPGYVCGGTGRCEPCGGAGQSCCGGGNCGSDAVCMVGVCVACGGSGQSCCPGNACSPSSYCQGGTCWDMPTLSDPSSEGPGCIDFGVAHAMQYWVVHGRPGAAGEKHVRHVSCAGAVDLIPSDGCFTLGADGSYSGLISNPVITDCSQPEFGVWQSYVLVDGQRSADSTVTYFDSMCAAVSTCAAAQTFCPTTGIGPGRPSCP